MAKIIIAGGREFDNYDALEELVSNLLFHEYTGDEIVSGAAKGADRLGEKFAKDKGILIKQFPADWDTHGKRAGYLRNAEMAEYADMLIAFWDGYSKGTKHMIDLALKEQLEVHVFKYRK